MGWEDASGPQQKMYDHSSNHHGHEASTDEEGIPMFQGCVGVELKYEVVVYSAASPHG